MIVVAVVTALPYLSSLSYEFVYDDHGVIVENSFLHDPANFRSVATLRTFHDPHVIDGQRPGVLVSYFTDRAIWGLNPAGWHATNLALHLVATLLVFLLGYKLIASCGQKSRDLSFLPQVAALLFGLHPVLTEAVQVPSFREDLFVTVFGLLYLLCAWVRRPWLAVLLQSALLALALLSKETAVVLPLLLVWLWCFVPSQRPGHRVGIAALSIQVTLVLAYLLNAYASRPLQAAGGTWNGISLQVPQNFLTMPLLFMDYVGLLLAPHPLCVEQLVQPVAGLADPRFWLGVSGVILFVCTAIILNKRAPLIALGMGWIFLGGLPVSNAVPLFNPLAERYLYFVAPAFALMLAAALAELPSRRLVWGLVVALAVSYGGLTASRLKDWRNDETLWNATILVEARSARAHSWLGLMRKAEGNRSQAQRYFRHADALNPYDISAKANMAIMAGEDGDFVRAEQLLREAIAIRPGKADLHWNLALALVYQGRNGDAMKEINRTLKLDPRHHYAAPVVRAMKEESARVKGHGPGP
jgi:tetratricopeptide (TPR) repeat protein